MDTEEAKFQKEFISYCHSIRWSAYHLSGESGLHDIIMLHKQYGITVELKVISSNKINHSVRSIFQESQMGFYLRQVQESETPTLVAIKATGDYPVYLIFILSSTQDVINFFSKKCIDLFVSSYNFVYCTDLIDHIVESATHG